jgi:hypothetical protein
MNKKKTKNGFVEIDNRFEKGRCPISAADCPIQTTIIFPSVEQGLILDFWDDFDVEKALIWVNSKSEIYWQTYVIHEGVKNCNCTWHMI